ncbi:MAG: 4-alpha-glucanotransferase [Verrucomicrobia bacterium]|nr:4-alpha-glucanotransferase [Verrucomicrobiota bacterium]MBS0646429.1 4-alpha-glucanotransferase [Verrucomicrobiota bacterium]
MTDDIAHYLSTTPAAAAWNKIGVRSHHGICLPLFALHSQRSCGIGEFLDLLPLLPWIRQIGMDVIQLLPLNDTGLETSPYSALSAFALNPIHLSLHALPHLNQISQVTEKLRKIAYWTQPPRVKHHIVRELKNAFFKEYIPIITPSITEDSNYQNFVQANQSWLEPYALFKSLKEKNYWRHWEEWPASIRALDAQHYQEQLLLCKESITHQMILQFLCYQQLSGVKKQAEQAGVWLKGDIPILINRDSADVWYHRQLFLTDRSAGAPPDMYSPDGQNWGFPLYDWSAMEREQHQWWKIRLKCAAQIYDIYRIDHIVGFFRIWAIPANRSAKEGYYFPSDSTTWIPAGERVMRMMLADTEMLPIGEDLGSVPPEVRQCLTRLGICGTKIMRWERRYDTDGGFIPPSDYPPISMTSVSTHDSDTLQLWWKHSPKEAKSYCDFRGWDYQPFLSLDRHQDILQQSHRSSSLFHINLLQEYLALFPPLVSDNTNQERINVPGKILDTNWTYRFNPSVEELVTHDQLTMTMKEMIK